MGNNSSKMEDNSNKIKREELKEADHIYSWRIAHIYAHHGIYAGGGKVIHFTGVHKEARNGNLISSSSSSKTSCQCGHRSHASGVIISCIDCFLSGGSLSRFRYGVSEEFFLSKNRGGTCTFAKSVPTVTVMHNARYLMENGFGLYDLFNKNCENFAVYCKTNLVIVGHCVGHSGQVGALIAGVRSIKNQTLRLIATSVSCAIAGPEGAVHILKGVYDGTGGTYSDKCIMLDIGKRKDVEKIPVERLVARFGSNDPDAAVERLVTESASNDPDAAVECLVTEWGSNEPDVIGDISLLLLLLLLLPFIFYFLFYFFILGSRDQLAID